MKKIYSILTAVLFNCLWMTTSAAASYYVVDGIRYYASSASATNVTVTALSPGKYSGDITIPGSFEYNSKTYTVTGVKGNAFDGCNNLTSVTIEEGPTTIEQYGFYNCSALTSIVLPSTITSATYYAFYNCAALESITFSGATPPTTFYASGSWPSIYNCANLEAIYVPAEAVETYKTAWEALADKIQSAAAGCAKPTDLTVLNVTTESAVISWTSEADKWNLEWKASDDENWTSVNGLTEKTYTLNELTALTTYNVRVQTDCGTETGLSSFVNAAPFTTKLCADENLRQISYTLTDSYGDGWGGAALKIVHKATGKTLETLTLGSGSSTTGTLNVCCGEALSLEWLTASQWDSECGFTLTDTFNDEVIIEHASGTAPSGTLAEYTINCVKAACAKPTSLAVSSTTPEGATFTWEGTADDYQYGVVAKGADAPTEWTKLEGAKTVTVEGYSAGTAYDFYVRAFCSESEQSDAVKVDFTPVCPAPTALDTVDGTLEANTVSVHWTAAEGISQYQYVVLPSTEALSWTSAKLTSETSADVTGLTPATTYKAYVRSYYSEYSQSAEISKEFTTECETKAIGWSENFGTTSAVKPICWTIEKWGTSANNWTTAGDYAKTGVALKYNAKTFNSADAISPSIEISDDAVLSFYVRNSVGSGSYFVECQVFINDGASDTEITETLNINKRYATATLLTYTLPSSFKGKTITIRFHAKGYDSSTNSALWIDDIAVETAPCEKPTALTATSVSATSVKLEWTSEVGKYNFQWREVGGEWSAAKETLKNDTILEGLSDTKSYEFQVQAVCSATRESDFVTSEAFAPVCPTPGAITLSNKKYNSVTATWTAGGGESSWKLSYGKTSEGVGDPIVCDEPTYTITGLEANAEYTIKVVASCEGTAAEATYTPVYTAPTNLQVSNISDRTATLTWAHVTGDAQQFKYAVVTKDVEPVPSSWDYTDNGTITTADINSLNPGVEWDVYVFAIYEGGGMSDTIKTNFTTVFEKPYNVQVAEVGRDTVKITWEKNGSDLMIEYHYAFAKHGEKPLSGDWLARTAKDITRYYLQANTQYDFYVCTYYNNIETSTDTIMITFTTECAAEALPFSQNFNGLTAIPECWGNEGSWNPWSISKTETDTFAYFYGGGETDNVLCTQAIELGAADYVLKIHYKQGANTKRFDVIVAENGSAERDTIFKEVEAAATWALLEADIPAKYANKEIVVRFAALAAGKDDANIQVNDIAIEALPSCRKPQNLHVESLRPDGAYITWQKGKDETQWQWFSIAANADTTGAVWDLVDGTIPEITLGGIENKTSLDVYVRSFCDPEVSEAVKTTFTVNCAAPTALVAEATGTTTASISWTAAADDLIKDYQYVVVTKDATPDWNNAVLVENATSATISEGLTAGKTYDVYVRSFVYPVTYSDEITASFSTECAAITSLPWSENFEAFVIGAAPACWETFQANGDGQAEIKVKTSLAWFTFDGQALLFAGTSEQEYAYIKFPEITASLTGKQITFTLQAENAEKSGAADFGYTDGEGVFHVLKQYAPTTSKTTVAPCLLDEVEGRLTFRYKAAAADAPYAIVIDNIVIDEAPTCAVPTDLAVSEVTTSSAKIAWTSDASAWKLQYKKGASEWTDVAGVITNPYLFEGLTENTKYAVRVAAVCGENNESEYCLAVNFTTECEPKAVSKETPWSENFDAETPNSVPSCWDEITANNEYAYIRVSAGSGIEETPALRLACQKTSNNTYDVIALLPELGEEISLLQIDFQYKNSNTNTNYGQLQVGYYSTGTFTAVQALERVDAFTAASVDFGDASIPEGARMAIKLAAGSNQAGSTATIDNIVVGFHPTCYTPKNFAAVATADGANLTWTAGKAEEEWNIRYKAKADVEWKTVENNITTASYTLTGLVEEVEYEAQVRAYCSALDQSEWSASVTFTPLGETTGIGNAEAEKKAIKLIENNQLVIIHNGVKYNALGEKIQ